MTAPFSPVAARQTATRALSPEALLAGPGALPDAPMAMPAQTLEHPQGLLRRMIAALLPERFAAPSAGARL